MNHRKITIGSVALAIAAACALTGCVTYSKVRAKRAEFIPTKGGAGELAKAEAGIVDAQRCERRTPMQALAGYISAAQIASQHLQRNPRDPQAAKDYNFAVARIITVVNDAKLDPWSHSLQVPAAGGDYVLSHKPDPRPQWNPALYTFTPADEFDINGAYVTRRTMRDGIGAPVVAIGKELNKNSRENLSLPRVYYGVTVIARFEGRRCVLAFYDPLAAETVDLNGRTYSMAADFTVPIAVMLASNDPNKLGLTRLLNPGKYAETARISRLQPYDPDKTVVLVIHGLMDSPATWTPMINTLRGDRDIRQHYQFWFYSYPSGYPYPYSAAILRRDLAAAFRKYPLRKPMVVIGHSMGGCISRLLITDAGDKLWMEIFKKPPEQVHMSPESKKLFMESLIFMHCPRIGRVIFISSPLKGSDLATNWIGRIGSSLVRAPSNMIQAGREAERIITYQPGTLRLKRIPNSVDTLAPNNRFVLAVNAIPIVPGVTYNTIMGDQGKGNAPHSSDGVVPYWSSHMDGAESECIVPSGHGAHQNPKAIEEVHRILKLNEHS